MPSPQSSLATLRPALAGSFMEYDLAMNQQGYIGHKVLPVMEVQAASGVFGRIPLEQLLQQLAAAADSNQAKTPGPQLL